MTLLHARYVVGVPVWHSGGRSLGRSRVSHIQILIRHSEGRSVVRVIGMRVRNAKGGRRISVEIEEEIHAGICRLETSRLRGGGS
jgi:hypothetical protein